MTYRWQKEPGVRLQGSRPLDSSKLQAPCVVALPSGGFRLFYTAVGPAKPFPNCQGYILSAISDDGLAFRPEPGIRIAPRPEIPHMSLRVIAPAVARSDDGRWRMYFEARGPATLPTVIRSAISSDLLDWKIEEGIRLESPGGVGAPRYLPLPSGGGRLFFTDSRYSPPGKKGGTRISQSIVSAITRDGLNFEFEPGYRMRDRQGDYDNIGITAAEVIPPAAAGDDWTMIFSVWQDAPPGRVVAKHPSSDQEAEANGLSQDFAAASIASDMSGYRSRIFSAASSDGMTWGPSQCIIEGAGYEAEGLDAVHAEDMSLVAIGQGRLRMYYAACDRTGNWRIASAISSPPKA